MKNNNIFIITIVVSPWKITRSWVIRNVWYVEMRPVAQFITLPNQALTIKDRPTVPSLRHCISYLFERGAAF